MSKIDELAKVLIDSTEIKDKKKTSAYDTTAKVVAVEGNVAWVSIAGGVEKTPASMVVAAKVGDDVRVRVGGGKAYVTGNVSAPPTDDSYARRAEEQALRAYRAADSASKSATEAQRSANSAIDSATIAGESATRAIADAATAHDAADEAQASADAAQTSADSAQRSADDAQVSADNAADAADRAIGLANAAQTLADTAQDAANSATTSANVALNHLGIVEDVVGVLDLLTKNGTYALTVDTEVIPDKWYFTRSGAGTAEDPYVYSVVTNPEPDPSVAEYYELTGVDEAIQNYVSSHLVLTDEGLFLQQSETATKLLLSTTDGVVLYGTDGHVVAKYGTETVIGDESGFHIKMGVNDQSGELGFYQGNNKVAYINNNKLYINQSVVVEQMDIGEPWDGVNSFGQWSWKLHKNANNKNNLNLKWIG